jgi:hypothetical protein
MFDIAQDIAQNMNENDPMNIAQLITRSVAQNTEFQNPHIQTILNQDIHTNLTASQLTNIPQCQFSIDNTIQTEKEQTYSSAAPLHSTSTLRTTTHHINILDQIKLMHDAFSLLAYDDPRGQAPYAAKLDKQNDREMLADALDAALLQQKGLAPNSQLNKLLDMVGSNLLLLSDNECPDIAFVRMKPFLNKI